MIEPGIRDKVVLITGANNPYGIGAGIARAFASQGCRVFLHYFRQAGPDALLNTVEAGPPGVTFYNSQQAKPADGVLGEIRKLGAEAHSWEAYLADASLIPLLFDQAERLLGPVEIVVNNSVGAATARTRARWEGMELVIESWMKTSGREVHFKDHWSLSGDGRTLTMAHRDDDLAGQISVLEKSSQADTTGLD